MMKVRFFLHMYLTFGSAYESFSSPGPKTRSELFWSLDVCRPAFVVRR